MSTVGALVDRLSVTGVRLVVFDGQLHCRAAPHVATPAIRAEITAHRDELIAFMSALPDGCIARTYACPVLGPCDRHRAGRPCLIAANEEAA